jgi:hypothetical protein
MKYRGNNQFDQIKKLQEKVHNPIAWSHRTGEDEIHGGVHGLLEDFRDSLLGELLGRDRC